MCIMCVSRSLYFFLLLHAIAVGGDVSSWQLNVLQISNRLVLEGWLIQVVSFWQYVAVVEARLVEIVIHCV